VKVLKGPIWEGKLLEYAKTFCSRRSEFEYQLSVHTALGVDALNVKVIDVAKMAQNINNKMDLLMQMFRSPVGPDEEEMTLQVRQRGRIKACLEDDKLLKELRSLEESGSQEAGLSSVATYQSGHRRAADAPDFEKLKEDLNTDPDDAIAGNLVIFNRKFAIQQRQLMEKISHIVHHEGDRIIDEMKGALISGPHDKIIDTVSPSTTSFQHFPNDTFIVKDVHNLWKEMVRRRK
jgi:hypothetical protein